MPSDWISFDCPESRKRWRYLDDGLIEIEGEGSPAMAWPSKVNEWRDLIEAAAAKHQVPPVWVAATMAMETGGRNLCLNKTPPPAVCGPPCACVQNEGAGVMAMLPSTASGLAGRSVSSQELMDDPPLAIDLGVKLLANLLDKYNDDYVKAAVAYNAGSVRCGRGKVFVPAGAGWPREPCPDTGWGVIFGCVYTDKKYGPRCQPSTTGFKAYVCSTVYPQRAIESQNASRQHFENGPRPPVPPPALARSGSPSIAGFVVGAVVGYALLQAFVSTKRGAAFV